MLSSEPWRLEAACRDVDPSVFYPSRSKLNAGRPVAGAETSESYRRAFAPAKAVCDRCPVAGECLEYALKNHTDGQDHGYWGNTTPPERRRIKRRRRIAAQKAARPNGEASAAWPQGGAVGASEALSAPISASGS